MQLVMPPPPPPPPPRRLPTSARTARELELEEAGVPRVFRRVMLSAPSSPTVGDETRLERPAVWVVVALLPCLDLGVSAALTRGFYTDLPAIAASAPWRGPAIMLGGVFPAMVSVVLGYMHLFLPRAPFALRKALTNVGFWWLGLPVWFSGVLVAIYGSTWVFVAMVCVVAILVAGVVTFWVSLARAYG